MVYVDYVVYVGQVDFFELWFEVGLVWYVDVQISVGIGVDLVSDECFCIFYMVGDDGVDYVVVFEFVQIGDVFDLVCLFQYCYFRSVQQWYQQGVVVYVVGLVVQCQQIRYFVFVQWVDVCVCGQYWGGMCGGVLVLVQGIGDYEVQFFIEWVFGFGGIEDDVVCIGILQQVLYYGVVQVMVLQGIGDDDQVQ